MLKDLIQLPLSNTYITLIITAITVFLLWGIFSIYSLSKKKNKLAASKGFEKMTLVITIVAFLFMLLMLVQYNKYFFKDVVTNSELDIQRYPFFLLTSFFASATIGLLVYAAIIVIRKLNDNFNDRKNFKTITKMFAIIGFIISLTLTVISLVYLVKNFVIDFQGQKSKAIYKILFFGANENPSLVNHMVTLFAYSISIYTVCKYIFLAVNEDSKTNTLKYLKDTVTGLIFVALFSMFALQIMKPLSGPFTQIKIMPVFFLIALFSYKYGYKKTVPFALLSATLMASITTNYNYSMALDSKANAPITYTIIGLVLMFYIPTVAMSLFGSIIGKKNIVFGSLLSNIVILLLRLLPTMIVGVVYVVYNSSELSNRIELGILAAVISLAYEHILTFIMFIFLNIPKNAREYLKDERLNNKQINENWIQFEYSFVNKGKKSVKGSTK